MPDSKFIPKEYLDDRTATCSRRVYLPEFAELDPTALPWRDWRRFPENFWGNHIAKISRRSTVVGFDFTGVSGQQHRIYIKRSLVRDFTRRLLAGFRSSKEWREMQMAHRFLKAGIVVPQPVLYAEARVENMPAYFLATKALDPKYQDGLDFFTKTRKFGAEWHSLAHFTRELHARGILHGDYRADHVYFDGDKEWSQRGDHFHRWALIDLDGSRFDRPVSRSERQRAILQMTESLLTAGIDSDALVSFLLSYDPDNQFRFVADDLMGMARERDRLKSRMRPRVYEEP